MSLRRNMLSTRAFIDHLKSAPAAYFVHVQKHKSNCTNRYSLGCFTRGFLIPAALVDIFVEFVNVPPSIGFGFKPQTREQIITVLNTHLRSRKIDAFLK